jgi:tetratricopeptide (TPR) repeat protein
VNAEYGFGKAAQELGDLDEALRRFEHVIDMAPRFSDGYFSRASVHSLRERYSDAVSDYATTRLLGEQAILQTDARIRAATERGTAVALAERRRLEDYKTHLEELLSYTRQNRAAIETYLRQVEESERTRGTVSAQ